MKVVALAALLFAAACGVESTPAPAPSTARMPFAIEHLTEGFAGIAQEVLHVSGYTYVAVRLEDDSVRWVVSMHKEIEEGAPVHARAFGKKRSFESKKLDRKFDELWFVSINVVTEGERS